MSTLVELTSAIIASQAASTSMSTEELLQSIHLVHASLKSLETGEAIPDGTSAPTDVPKMSIKKAFGKKDKIFCMICGKGFTTLKRHLTVAHGLKPSEYRKQFGIKSTQSLAAQNYVESRRQSAIEKNLGAGLEKARATRKANAAKKVAVAPAAKKTMVAVPAVKVNVPVTAIKNKAAAPVKVELAKAPVKAKKAPFVKAPPKSKK